MRIAIDAMGGDHAPGPVVEGALLARSSVAADLVLIGNEPVVRELLRGERPVLLIRKYFMPPLQFRWRNWVRLPSARSVMRL